jgi:hypothetical protein
MNSLSKSLSLLPNPDPKEKKSSTLKDFTLTGWTVDPTSSNIKTGINMGTYKYDTKGTFLVLTLMPYVRSFLFFYSLFLYFLFIIVITGSPFVSLSLCVSHSLILPFFYSFSIDNKLQTSITLSIA